jgi:hypothetical protein
MGSDGRWREEVVMRLARVIVSVALLLGAGVVASPSAAHASRLSAADLAADCNDDGLVTITTDTTYTGGSAELVGVPMFGNNGCRIDLTVRGVALRLVNVRLHSAAGGAFLNIGQSSVGETSITIQSSQLDMDAPSPAGGYLSIKTGCCGGLPTENDTSVVIRNSDLHGTGIELGASLAGPRGAFSISNSTVVATGDPYLSVPDIMIRVSEGGAGADGNLEASRSTFRAPGGFEAVTGATGRTSLIRNDLTGVTGGITITTGAGGTCESVANTPAVACT